MSPARTPAGSQRKAGQRPTGVPHHEAVGPGRVGAAAPEPNSGFQISTSASGTSSPAHRRSAGPRLSACGWPGSTNSSLRFRAQPDEGDSPTIARSHRARRSSAQTVFRRARRARMSNQKPSARSGFVVCESNVDTQRLVPEPRIADRLEDRKLHLRTAGTARENFQVPLGHEPVR